jgi:hypothetical protein
MVSEGGVGLEGVTLVREAMVLAMVMSAAFWTGGEVMICVD